MGTTVAHLHYLSLKAVILILCLTVLVLIVKNDQRRLEEIIELTTRLGENTSFENKLLAANCIEDNICKANPNDAFYIYRRKPNFNEKVDMPIDNDKNIIHSYEVVPNIVHFIQYTEKVTNVFEFHHMVSVLSAYKIIRPERIYFWLDQEPESEYWQRIRETIPNLYLIYRERPTSIRGRRVHFITKVSNVVRLEAILEYGGMYFDLDVIVLRPFTRFLKYDVTMGKENADQFCNAVIIARPWADFLRAWHREHYNLDENVWAYHSGHVPYLLSKKYPNLVHVEKTAFFRPAWYELDPLYKNGSLHDWQNNNYCIHLWIRVYKGKRYTDKEIDTWNSTIGQIYRYILYDDWIIESPDVT